MLRDKEHNRLFRRVEVRIVYPPDVIPDKTDIYRAGPHQGFSSSNIDDLLMKTAERLDELYPYWHFELVEIKSTARTARYVLKFAGYARPQRPADQVKTNGS